MDDVTRARLERLANMPILAGASGITVNIPDLQALLAAYTAARSIVQAAEQARDRAHEDNLELTERILRQKGTIDWLQGKVTAAEAARDQYKRERDDFEHVLQDTEDFADADEELV